MEKNMSRLTAISQNPDKGPQKHPVRTAQLITDLGLKGDYHARGGLRQISLMEQEVLAELKQKGLDVAPGRMGENLTVEGIVFSELPVGSHLKIGDQALLEITMERTPCKSLMAIDRQLPKWVIGRCGLMARVIRSGTIRTGDIVIVARYGVAIDNTPPRTDCPPAAIKEE
jgi:MOSC domain-containing protein YiiM